MNPLDKFDSDRDSRLSKMRLDSDLHHKSLDWMIHADKYKYSYNFEWLGIPIIKYPNDMVVYQELIWKVKPDLIIETGVALGGSIVFAASILEMIGQGQVIGIDIDIREHNRKRLEQHRLFNRISLIESDSLSLELHDHLNEIANSKKTLVVLDSHHSHDHVLAELKLFSRYINIGSYIVLPDTFIEYFPKGYYSERPWDVGNNPMTALEQFLQERPDFEIDTYFSSKALISESFCGYIKKKER
jgi:cephalosporin hydroxylase